MLTRRMAALCLLIGLAFMAGPDPAEARTRHRGQEARIPAPASHPSHKPNSATRSGARQHRLDHSGRVQRGQASYYGPEFNGRRMASGRRFNPQSNAAASRTLPLGTTARVTSLRTGRSAEVRVEDRGPRVPGRITDVTPKVADELGMRREGTTPVEVAPITVPQPDGSLRPGAGAGGR
jgi:rare lipoprotein A